MARASRTASTESRLDASQPPFVLRQLVRGYRTGAGTVEVLRGVNLTVSAGELIIIAGPSGSGKSTLLSVMGGLLRPDSGELALYGEDLADLPEKEVQRIRQLRIGYIFQQVHLMPALTARENVSIALEIKKSAAHGNDYERKLLELVGLGDCVDRLPATLSGRQRQRVGIARALAGDPTIILADEPTAALDTRNALAIMKLLKELTAARGLATIVVTHDRRLYGYANRILELNYGRLRERRLRKKTPSPQGGGP